MTGKDERPVKRMAVWMVCLALACSALGERVPSVVLDYVFELAPYTALDYSFAEQFFAAQHDNWGGGCTAAAKVLDDGTMLVGRNMDLALTNKAAYIVRTAVPGCYETLGLMYTHRNHAPDFAEVLQGGLPEDFAKVVPFLVVDVMNAEGLYIEANMRSGERWPDGTNKYACSGTQPASLQRVYLFGLSRYLAEHCKDVAEALAYVDALNLYTEDGFWSYGFLLADASGRFGVLEVAQNRVIWHEGQPVQTNFYLDAELFAIEERPAGLGRYETVMAGLAGVSSAEEMLALMDQVTFRQCYTPASCRFDWRSEWTGTYPAWTLDYVLDERNRDELTFVFSAYAQPLMQLSRARQRDSGAVTESIYTVVADCTHRTMTVRFFEDDRQVLHLGFHPRSE